MQTPPPVRRSTTRQKNEASKDRALHVVVADEAIKNARRAAVNSEPPFRLRHFIERLLLSAKPIITGQDDEAGAAPADDDAAHQPEIT